MARESFFSVNDIFRDRRRLFVFLLCVAVSLFSWLMIAFSKEYNSTVIIPISYMNFPENKVLLNTIPENLAINVSGIGYDLIGIEDELSKDTLVINLDNLQMSSIGGFQRGYLDPALLSKALQSRLSGSVAINRVLSDSIEFLFDLKVSRLIPVTPKVNYTIAAGYTLLDSIKVIPSEVEIFGPLSILDTLKHVNTLPISAGELNQGVVFKSALHRKQLSSNALIRPDSVGVSLKIDRLTEKRFMVTPQQFNVPDSLELITFPNAIELIVQVPISLFNDVSRADFDLNVDYSERQPNHQILPVNCTKWPVQANKLTLKPKQVEIVVSKKEE